MATALNPKNNGMTSLAGHLQKYIGKKTKKEILEWLRDKD